jgi:N-glycosylase/DNA lyase
VVWSTIEGLENEAAALLADYLSNNRAYQDLYDTLPWRSDPHLKECMETFPHLRILRQPHGETLLGFLCSATKQIIQIKEMLRLLRDQFGTPLPSGHNALPNWEQLLQVEEASLRACKFGFRAANISKTAKRLHQDKLDLNALAGLPYQEAKATLCSLHGVGEKVADCVLLFGYDKLQAFPVDTWIIKVMKRHYDLEDWSPKQIAHFGRTHFGSYAGLAQQFLFAWERKQARK